MTSMRYRWSAAATHSLATCGGQPVDWRAACASVLRRAGRNWPPIKRFLPPSPIPTLLGFIETLRGPARDDRGAHDRFLAIMHEQASRMARLIEDLLSLSRIEMNEHLPPTGRANLSQVLGSVAATLELRAKA